MRVGAGLKVGDEPFGTEPARQDADAAIEIARLPRLIKGYSDTFERGLANYTRLIDAVPAAMRFASAEASSDVTASNRL